MAEIVKLELSKEHAERLFDLVASICNDHEDYIKVEREKGATEEDLASFVEDLEVYGEVWQKLKVALNR